MVSIVGFQFLIGRLGTGEALAEDSAQGHSSLASVSLFAVHAAPITSIVQCHADEYIADFHLFHLQQKGKAGNYQLPQNVSNMVQKERVLAYE